MDLLWNSAWRYATHFKSWGKCVKQKLGVKPNETIILGLHCDKDSGIFSISFPSKTDETERGILRFLASIFNLLYFTASKVSKYGVFWSVFSCIQSEYWKIQTRKKLRIWTLFIQYFISLLTFYVKILLIEACELKIGWYKPITNELPKKMEKMDSSIPWENCVRRSIISLEKRIQAIYLNIFDNASKSAVWAML